MNHTLLQRCELFVSNRDIMKDRFKWDSGLYHPLVASLYTEKGRIVDPEKIKNCKTIMKNNTGLFSEFRATAHLPLAALLSLESHPEGKFQEILQAYEALKKEFRSSAYLPLSAFFMAVMLQSPAYDGVVRKAKDIFQRMKKEHPFLTSGEDCGFAVMLAMSEMTPSAAIMEMEKCYAILKSRFSIGNALQTLSHTLTLGGESAQSKCDRIIRLFDLLKENNCKYGTGAELAVLGVLAISTPELSATIRDIVEANQFLLGQKGFGRLGMGKAQRIMYAAILVSQENKQASQNALGMASINSVTSLLIAEQAAIAAVIAASAAAASTAGN
mgnify:CR=1 FL=1